MPHYLPVMDYLPTSMWRDILGSCGSATPIFIAIVFCLQIVCFVCINSCLFTFYFLHVGRWCSSRVWVSHFCCSFARVTFPVYLVSPHIIPGESSYNTLYVALCHSLAFSYNPLLNFVDWCHHRGSVISIPRCLLAGLWGWTEGQFCRAICKFSFIVARLLWWTRQELSCRVVALQMTFATPIKIVLYDTDLFLSPILSTLSSHVVHVPFNTICDSNTFWRLPT